MKHFMTMLLVIALIGVSFAQTTSSVTFKVNMGPAAARGLMTVGVDNAYLSGTMNGWNGSSIPMTRDESTTDTIYTITLNDMVVDSTYEYKFLAAGNWELLDGNDDIHRLYKVKANAAENNVPVAFYSNDSTYPQYPIKNIKVSFKCNMELEIAKGAFDPSVDLISVRAGFSGWSGGVAVMKKPLVGTIFSFDTTFTMIPGHTFEYVYTYDHANNTSWEGSGVNYVFELTEEEYIKGENVELRYFNDNDTGATATGYSIYFSVDMNGAQADIGGVKTDFPNGVKRIAIVGGEFPLAWPALGWPDSDTTKCQWMNDLGENGDLFAGDNIWTGKLDFLKGSMLRLPYKYGANYGMPEDNAGSNDNELFITGDANRWITIPKEATAVRTHDVWGTVGEAAITGVKSTPDNTIRSYSLEQNYPNPFNPSTTIRYSVPEDGLVTLKVYNMLGEEVATLVNEIQSASVNTVNFDASNFSSGVYMYQITAKNFTASKKMMIMK